MAVAGGRGVAPLVSTDRAQPVLTTLFRTPFQRVSSGSPIMTCARTRSVSCHGKRQSHRTVQTVTRCGTDRQALRVKQCPTRRSLARREEPRHERHQPARRTAGGPRAERSLVLKHGLMLQRGQGSQARLRHRLLDRGCDARAPSTHADGA